MSAIINAAIKYSKDATLASDEWRHILPRVATHRLFYALAPRCMDGWLYAKPTLMILLRAPTMCFITQLGLYDCAVGVARDPSTAYADADVREIALHPSLHLKRLSLDMVTRVTGATVVDLCQRITALDTFGIKDCACISAASLVPLLEHRKHTMRLSALRSICGIVRRREDAAADAEPEVLSLKTLALAVRATRSAECTARDHQEIMVILGVLVRCGFEEGADAVTYDALADAGVLDLLRDALSSVSDSFAQAATNTLYACLSAGRNNMRAAMLERDPALVQAVCNLVLSAKSGNDNSSKAEDGKVAYLLSNAVLLLTIIGGASWQSMIDRHGLVRDVLPKLVKVLRAIKRRTQKNNDGVDDVSAEAVATTTEDGEEDVEVDIKNDVDGLFWAASHLMRELFADNSSSSNRNRFAPDVLLSVADSGVVGALASYFFADDGSTMTIYHGIGNFLNHVRAPPSDSLGEDIDVWVTTVDRIVADIVATGFVGSIARNIAVVYAEHRDNPRAVFASVDILVQCLVLESHVVAAADPVDEDDDDDAVEPRDFTDFSVSSFFASEEALSRLTIGRDLLACGRRACRSLQTVSLSFRVGFARLWGNASDSEAESVSQ